MQRMNTLRFLFHCTCLVGAWGLLSAQDIRVIRVEGSSAIINAGSNLGFRQGGLVRVMRMRNGMWKEISSARIVQVTPDVASIEVASGAPAVTFRPGDLVVKLSLTNRTTTNGASTALSPSSSQENPQAAESLGMRRTRGVSVGPSVDMLLPQGEMRTCFDDRIGYGGVLGFQFQNNFDLSIRFIFASRRDDWSFWDLQLLGRLYDASNLFADFGYGICYPSIHSKYVEECGNIETIQMGFVLGAGYPLPLSMNKQFEIGFLYHYYPSFGKTSGQFFTLHGRLIIRS